MGQYYLRIDKDNNNFEFVVEGIHEIKETDIRITLDDYNYFFELQSQGKQFMLKETSNGNTLFDYIEENSIELPEVQEQGIEEYLLELEYRISKLELGV